MTAPYLPDDCIYYILKYLQPHHSTLFNCLLVNRFWCKATVPLLYVDPFCTSNPFLTSNRTKNFSVISTLILCFDKAEILQLKNQLKLATNIDIININDWDKPLFEYLKYLENFDYYKIDTMIFHWLGLSFAYYEILRDNFIPIFYQSILCQCNNIKQLSIPLHDESYKNCNIQTFTSSLAKLTSLTLHINIGNNKTLQSYLNSIENICSNLFKFGISTLYKIPNNNVDRKKLCAIIQKQNNLKVIELSSYFQNILNDIFLSLEFQKYSLVHIEFKDINFSNISFKNFINLCNLKYLRFERCKGLSLDQCETLKYASFKLEGLYFEYNWWNNDNFTIPSMTKYLGISLKELILYEFLKIPNIENISTYCPNLITLEITIGSVIVDSLIFSYFKNLKIRNLNINDDWSCWNFEYIDDFKYLGNNLSTNVKEVSFNSYRLLSFKKFLANCHNCLERINLSDSDSIGLGYLEIILYYIERSNNSLKFLGIKKLKKVLFDEENSRLLDQIKAKGVKIVDFHSIYKCDDSFIL